MNEPPYIPAYTTSPAMSTKSRSSLSKANQGASPILDRTELFKDPTFRRLIQLEAQAQLQRLSKLGIIRVAQAQRCTPLQEPTYAPRMDLIDDPEQPYLAAIFEVPGLKSSEISVELHPPFLEILGTRRASYAHQLAPRAALPSTSDASSNSNETQRQASPSRKTRVLLNELRYGRFRRCIKMPEWIKQSDIKASLAEGMLTVTWPRGPESSDIVMGESELLKSSPATTPSRPTNSSPTMSIPAHSALGTASQ